jgi:hypothetical protein
MNARATVVFGSAIVMGLLLAPSAFGQTPIAGGFEMSLLPGYAHEPLQGIDSIVGKIAKKDGLAIQYEMGRIPKGGLRLGGDFTNQAQQLPEKDRLWLKEQTAGGRKIHIAYGKDGRLVISSASESEGVNFHTVAKTPGEVTDVLLMVLTLAEKKPRPAK